MKNWRTAVTVHDSGVTLVHLEEAQRASIVTNYTIEDKLFPIDLNAALPAGYYYYFHLSCYGCKFITMNLLASLISRKDADPSLYTQKA